MEVRLPFSSFLAIFIRFTYFPIFLVILVQFQNFFGISVSKLFFPIVISIFYAIYFDCLHYTKYVFIVSNKSSLDFNKYTLNLLYHIPIHDFLCFATYGCCHLCQHLFTIFNISFTLNTCLQFLQ